MKFIKQRQIVLEWSTQSETNNFGFEIQRRQNGFQFQKIGFVKGNNTSSFQYNYAYVDTELPAGTYYYRLKQIYNNGSFEFSVIRNVVLIAPLNYDLKQNYPNPFNQQTTIKYQLPQRGYVKLEIYDVLGHIVRTLVNEIQSAGSKKVSWHGKDDRVQSVPSGLYMYQIQTGEFLAMKKLLLMVSWI